MKRSIFLNSGFFLSILPALSIHGSESDSKALPNVIFILADDLGIGDLGCYGQKRIKTPAIDRLAENGMKFTQHYSGSTVSAPSRCVLLTGKHTGHAFIRGNKGYRAEDGRMYDMNLASDEVTVAELFKKQNYTTACIGKWGLGGPSGEGHPNNQGFDYFFGYLGQGNAHSYYPDRLFENNTPVILGNKVYSHDLIIGKALDFLEKQGDNPFFLYLTPTIPHASLTVPENDYMGYDRCLSEDVPFPAGHYSRQDKPHAAFAAMVSRLDRDVQRLIDLLDRKGILDNTIIIFTSDNGTHVEGGHDPMYFDSNGPFRGTKRDLYEGGIRTPFIVSWPSVVQPGTVSFHISTFWDFLPTVCELINVSTPPNIDGISYLPTLQGLNKQKQHENLYFEFHEQGGKQAIICDRWKLVRLNVNQPSIERYELYNLNADPGETSDVAVMYPEKVQQMKKIMFTSHIKNKNWKFIYEK